ncbi:MAG TPA: stimulus-sensing domain-containing protein [Rhodospirillales bacterium]|jgi:two-component system sensor histidine kinase ChvG|nr:stimulus-sensing domain-containing protein [Rhodospirillales bacterium]HJO68165.1 stimulus-sensing domain-containing protein [Rhodospirillales bacterium]
MTTMMRRHRRGRAVSPITLRILAVNILALAILLAGMLYLGAYRRSLIEGELAALGVQAELFAAALGEGAVGPAPSESDGETAQRLAPEAARQILRRMVETSGVRARLFAGDGALLVDSRELAAPTGSVEIEELPPPRADTGFAHALSNLFDRALHWLPGTGDMPPYRESAPQVAGDYDEVVQALGGEPAGAARGDAPAGMVISAAVPVQRYKRVLGALMLSKGSRDIEAALLEVRVGIVEVFAVVLGVTVLLSLYLAGTIARPIRRLAAAAERVRAQPKHRHAIPDFGHRDDEIGELADALRDMTVALWQRMDAIEGFAADVAHEIKNPLTSLRSAVETAARVTDADQRRRLFAIILDDVQRIDRLITDISQASRLDAELSRAETGPVDVTRMLATLVAVHTTTTCDGAPRLRLAAENASGLVVNGIEGRLVQVFNNLIANAESFSPPGGRITLDARKENGAVTICVEDEGPGIPGGKEDAIFDRFYSERPPGEKFGIHSGLGLSISKQIVASHDGTLTAENLRDESGRVRGTRFTVRLPTE